MYLCGNDYGKAIKKLSEYKWDYPDTDSAIFMAGYLKGGIDTLKSLGESYKTESVETKDKDCSPGSITEYER